MRPVRREDIIDYVTYDERRAAIREVAMAAKLPRRIHVGEHFTFLFENTTTVRYQIQEMVRAERMVRENDIRHEIETYNELIGGPGELGATLLIEITDEADRRTKLTSWTSLPEHVYAKLEDGTRAYAVFDMRQVDPGKLSSVHYLKFPLGGRTPVALGCDLEGAQVETLLTAEQRAALGEDLVST